MTVRSRRLRQALAVSATLLVAVLSGCSGDDDTESGPVPGGERSGPGSYADVRPDISPRGYAALGCSLHTTQRTLDPAEVVNRRDPRGAAFAATWSLLVAAGVGDEDAYGALVEPASSLQLVHPQGAADRVAGWRTALTRECADVGRVADGPHVRAAYACRILDRLGETAPSVVDLLPDRATTAADELDAAVNLARAAAADEDYHRLARRAGRLQEALAAEAGSAVHEQRRAQVVAACRQLDRAG